MEDLICPVCGKSNSSTLEVCQYCGAGLIEGGDETPPDANPGDELEEKKTPGGLTTPHDLSGLTTPHDLSGATNRTLPGWLRDFGQTSKKDNNYPGSENPAPEDTSFETPVEPSEVSRPEPVPFTDYLAGLANLDDEEETPEWLKNLSDNLQTPQQVETGLPPEQEPTPDLLTPPPPEPTLEPTRSENDQNFFGEPVSFRFEDEDNPEPETPRDPTELPDWLNEIPSRAETGITPSRAETGITPSRAETGITPSRAEAGNFTAPEEQSLPETEADSPAHENLPGWLANLPEPVDETVPAQSESAPLEQQPDSTNTKGAHSAEPTDWLSSLGDDFSINDSSRTADLPSLPVGETPDWLARLGTGPLEQAEPQPDENAPAADEPNWLASLQSSNMNSTESTGAPSTDEFHDWLDSLQIHRSGTPGVVPDRSAAKPEIPEPATVPPFEDIPDWLANLQTPTLAEDEINRRQETAEHPASSSLDARPAEAAASSRKQKPFDPDSLSEYEIPTDDSELPDWLAHVGQPPSRAETGITPKPDKTTAQDASRPPAGPQTSGIAETKSSQPDKTGEDSLSEVSALIPASGEDQNIDSILSMETPEWLSDYTPAGAEQKDDQSGNPPETGDLPTLELPSWVQAMRPMESVIEGTNDNEEDKVVEDQGPLSGLQSVLPTQSLPLDFQTTKSYAADLFVNETQQAQAALLENLLKSENTPQVFSRPSKKTKIQPVRWLIAIVLLAVLLILAVFKSKIIPAPAISVKSGPVGIFIKTVTGLAENAPVLVVVDYQPAFSGEMETAAGPIMEHLLSKHMRLAFVSTTPVGGLMAERLLQKFAGRYNYQSGIQYVNLGYLPGGASSIKVFAELPASTLGNDSLSGNLWNSPVLKDVTVNSETRLSNFAAVIVATDDPETGRMWIEQAQPALGTRPMLMVISAQAEPMLQPYFLSGQVKGMVSGLEGGMLYENTRGIFGQARAYWDSFGAGILVTELIILIGGIWSLRSGLQNHRAGTEQDET